MADRRTAAVAGRFYPGSREKLQSLVDSLVGEVDVGHRAVPALMVPHAGLAYSGACAARVFRAVDLADIAVILSPNHTGLCAEPGTASVWSTGAFATPLGDVPVAEEAVAALRDLTPLVVSDRVAHQHEHGIEMELPFLCALFPDTAIVPLVLNWDSWDKSRELGRALAELATTFAGRVALVVSSDMNHFESVVVADRKDKLALEKMKRLDGEGLLNVCHEQDISMCGRAGAAAAVEALTQLGGKGMDILDYRNSGWVTRDLDSVVSYAGTVLE